MSIGEFIKATRLEKNLTISQVARDLLIQEKYIQAIEEGNYDIIPGEVFQRAYFRKYTDYLDLKEYIESLTRSHRTEPDDTENSTDNIFGGKWDTTRWTRVFFKLAVIILIPVLIVIAVKAQQTSSVIERDKPSSHDNGQDRENNDRTSVTGTQKIQVIPTDLTQPDIEIVNGEEEPDIPTQPAGNGYHKLRLQAIGMCYIVVATPDGNLYRDNLFTGQMLFYEHIIGFYVRSGKPENLDVWLDDELQEWEGEGHFSMTLPEGSWEYTED